MTIVATIAFPQTPPVTGHFESLAVIDELGYLDRSGDYRKSLERAGFFVCKIAGDVYLDVAAPVTGVFHSGVGEDAVRLLSALASEGFSGVLRDEGAGLSWFLSGGRLVSPSIDLKVCA